MKLGQHTRRHPVNFFTLSLSPAPRRGYEDLVFLCTEPCDPNDPTLPRLWVQLSIVIHALVGLAKNLPIAPSAPELRPKDSSSVARRQLFLNQLTYLKLLHVHNKWQGSLNLQQCICGTWGNFVTRQNRQSQPESLVGSDFGLNWNDHMNKCQVSWVNVGDRQLETPWQLSSDSFIFIYLDFGGRKAKKRSICCRVIYWTNENAMETFRNWTVWETNMTMFWEGLKYSVST